MTPIEDAEETIRLAATSMDAAVWADDWPDFIAQVKRAAAKAAWDEAIEEALDGWTIPASGDIEAVRYILLSTNPYIPEEAA